MTQPRDSELLMLKKEALHDLVDRMAEQFLDRPATGGVVCVLGNGLYRIDTLHSLLSDFFSYIHQSESQQILTAPIIGMLCLRIVLTKPNAPDAISRTSFNQNSVASHKQEVTCLFVLLTLGDNHAIAVSAAASSTIHAPDDVFARGAVEFPNILRTHSFA